MTHSVHFSPCCRDTLKGSKRDSDWEDSRCVRSLGHSSNFDTLTTIFTHQANEWGGEIGEIAATVSYHRWRHEQDTAVTKQDRVRLTKALDAVQEVS